MAARALRSTPPIRWVQNPLSNNLIDPHLDVTSIRSINEDVLKAPTDAFHRTHSPLLALKTGVLDLSGHGTTIYITSPDLSALSSLGPQGEASILAKVTGDEAYGRVITHSPFAELDYFRASNSTFKRIRFRLIFPTVHQLTFIDPTGHFR